MAGRWRYSGQRRSTAPLLGRHTEFQALDQFLDAVRAGESRALVVRGDPGVGKTVLLNHLVQRASGCRVAHAAGVESEMELVYAGLHQLLTPMLGRLEQLPGPQADALRTAFGLSSGPAPDRFLVGLATLGLLADVAEKHPLICLVDDAQWLDRTSAQALAFAARRLHAESVGVVFATRVPAEELEGLPQLVVDGLRETDARGLLDTVVTGPLDPRVRDRILAEAAGNPLALLELPRGGSPAGLAGGFPSFDAMPVSGRIEKSFRLRLEGLPADSQRLLRLAAAEPVGDPVLMWRAAERLGIGTDAATPAAEAGLLEIGARVLFRHPLVRSTAYQSASRQERQQIHRALAEATDPQADPDRRAWHWAQAAPGPAEGVAAELERSAGRAQARGGLAAAAAFLTRATELTPDPAERVRRALDAAYANVQAGSFDPALTLIAVARNEPLEESQRARIDLLQAELAFASSRGTEATPLLLAAARRLEPIDGGLAREVYLDAFSAALFGARLNDSVTVADVAHAASRTPRPDGAPTTADLLLDGLAALAGTYRAGVVACRRALQALTGDQASPAENVRRLWLGSVVALELWDDQCAYSLSDRSVETARRTGSLSELALALSARTPVLVFCGDLSAAASSVVETESVEEATGIRAAPYGALILAAWRGHEREAGELIEVTVREAGARGEGIGLAIAQYTRAVLCNSLGRYDEALLAARSAAEHREVVAENWGLSELVEAAVRTDATSRARDALERLTEKARATGTDWALGVEARSRALLGRGAAAEDDFREAVHRLDQTRIRAELARTHLLYGEWLRREGRRVDARERLRTAQETFEAVGMEAFAERARRELRATGETARKRTTESHDELTAQEALIARLAVQGLSNPEIGARLFISSRTVKYHLGKVFAKLGVSSRAQLNQALPGDPTTA
jgi:DNA-binding CsgD family transcriptional regulator